MIDSKSPPAEFDEPFFRWLDRMSEALWVQFASPGSVHESDLARLEQNIGWPLPADIRRFYERYDPWSPLRDYWSAWEFTEREIGGSIVATAPLVPIDCRSCSSQGSDTVAVIHGPDRYEVVERRRATGVVRRYPDLRSYFLAGVGEESGD